MTEIIQQNSTTPVTNSTKYNCYDENDDDEPQSTVLLNRQQPSSGRSNGSGKRCEAFLMTGDKILNLNTKISPLYAAAYREQLPPEVEIASPLKPETCKTNDEIFYKSAGTLNNYETTPKRRINQQKNDEKSNDSSILTLPENAIHSTINNENETTFNKVPSFLNPKYVNSQEATTSCMSTPTTMNRIAKYDSGNGRSISLSQQNINDIEKLVKTMYNLNGYTKNNVTDILLRNDNLIIEKFFEQFNFTGVRIDVSIRHFLEHVCLKGESNERANLLESFANRYYECNPTLFNNSEQVHALTCALILLNTDLHGENLGKKMTIREFISNLEHTDYNYEKNLLRSLYNSIKKQPFKYDENESMLNVEKENKKEKKSVIRRVITRKESLIHVKDQIDYYHGWVLRKCVYDVDGKPTPKGRRGWKMMYATVRGMVLYLHKDEHGFESGKFKTYQNCICLHHSIATIAADYNKKQHVFRLRTANYSEYLFQTSNPNELNKWIDVINYVAAAFSAPTLPLPVSADYKWIQRRPILPSTPSNLTIPDQLRSHVSKIEETNKAIEDLQKNAPKIQAKTTEVQNYFRVERLYLDERERYTLYANVLKDKLHQASQTTLCSRNNSTKIIHKNYITNIPVNGQKTNISNGTLSSSSKNGGSMKSKKTVSEKSAALVEAMAIADGRIPKSIAGDSEYSNDSYR